MRRDVRRGRREASGRKDKTCCEICLSHTRYAVRTASGAHVEGSALEQLAFCIGRVARLRDLMGLGVAGVADTT